MKPVRIIGLSAFAVVIITLLGSCGSRTEEKRLSDIESYIDSRPDSALAAIRAIDTTALRGRAVKAKYSLLHAMALDKNYIDTADTRIVQPAVDWYSRHGSPEEKLKAWMYLGTEQYNGKQYNKAIVSFYKAIDSFDRISDNNILGVLYSKIADTYTKTMDYAQASSFIDKSLECFRSCGRKDQESLELLHKASNLAQRRLWDNASTCYKDILSITPLDPAIKGRASMDYGVFLLIKPNPDEGFASSLIESALDNGVSFGSVSQMYAYWYLLKSQGKDEESETYKRLAELQNDKDEYSVHYWEYRSALKSGKQDDAYRSLWSAMNAMDSIRMSNYVLSAANAQRSYLEQVETEKALRAQGQRRKNMIISLLCLVLGLVSAIIYLLYQKVLHKQREERERMTLAIENLENQILCINKANKQRTVFAFLGEIYEEAYLKKSSDCITADNLSKVIQSRIGDLKSDPEAQRSFEKLVDNKLDGLMSRFRKDCPDLSESDYRMSSYYFAGFDNTTVMIIMGISSLESTRSRKRYLRKKLSTKYGTLGDYYSSIIGS